MANKIAIQTNRFTLWDTESGKRLDGTVTVQMPAFENATNAFSGAGVGGEINVPAIGMMNALTATLSVPKISRNFSEQCRLAFTRTWDLRADVSVTNSANHQIEQISERWVLKGPVTKSDPGKIEQKATSDATFEMQIYYAINWLDGKQHIEWDPFNTIYKINGVDQLATTRRHLGL